MTLNSSKSFITQIMQFLVLDTEYTSWEGAAARNWSAPGEFKELVQLSSIKISDLRTFHNSRFFSLYTKPTRNKQLSNYFVDLTGISQSTINTLGVPIDEAIDCFGDFSKGIHCFSWDNDIEILEENIRLLDNGKSLQIKKHTDIRLLFQFFGFDCSQNCSSDISSMVPGQSPVLPGNGHNALSDCISLLSATHKLGQIYGFDHVEEVMTQI